ncbi:murein hydrolase activator EnvC family protein [Roseospira visakhapatnamensis]|uniref:Septal ring factor EnvC (AmiA/AmiB activator) n=1 Tax=Roseospira visakhapatnamensis TaxID=390880 RepID=A0A7W6RDP0_9PROT|nr:peptidoglycan DD-metalloendopeptidase family protein [Roseospira visakhapatnamensis]MBB4266620.1 septal ring factor EnvC (AmiA/AmiB activator) [Roseospira visakhapatnamensis]
MARHGEPHWGPWPDPRHRRLGRVVTAPLVRLAALALGVWLAVVVAPDAARAADPAAELRTLEERLDAERAAEQALRDRREALAAEVRRVREQVIESAAAIQDAEDNLSALEDRLAALHTERDRMGAALARRDRQMAQVLTALQRLAWRPTEALIVQPTPPADTVRSAILLRAAVPRIEENARALARELARLRGLDAAITVQQAEIADQAEALRVAHGRMQALFDRKAALQRDTLEREREAAARVARLGREASDLRDLIARLEAERRRREIMEAERRAAEARRRALAEQRRAMELERAERLARLQAARAAAERTQAAQNDSAADQADAATPPAPAEAETATEPAPVTVAPVTVASVPPAPPRSFTDGRGGMPMPVRGRLVTRFGDADDLGAASQGVTVRSRAGAQVVAPYDGMVAFAGPFRGYGLLLIIEHTDGYHSLLAGMNRIDSRVGQTVRAGEPVGVMGGGDPVLYIELRRKGRPINPLPWMAAGTDTGKG